jgi:uncharacterized protein
MSNAQRLRCRVCQRRFDPQQSDGLPFCSARCRQIDLKRWLGEEYHVPVEHKPDDEELPPEAS